MNENKNDKVSSGENYKNKNMVLENNGENIGSDNEILMGIEYDNDGMLVCDELERKWRESIIVKGLQRVNFFRVGELKASHVFRKDESAFSIYLEDDMSANKVPWVFCALHRWLSLIHISVNSLK